MALANTAAMLAKAGRRVLMIDFDLEAPGLDSFSELSPPKSQRGVVEYVAEYLKQGRPVPVGPFVHECVPRDDPIRGHLWLMPSGARGPDYNTKRMSIRWAELYAKHDGQRFIENWKADVVETFAPDYVFIDSRTGLTDVGGVCTLHFPDLVVLLFSLNDQNIDGISEVANVLKQSEKPPLVLPVATPIPNLPRDNERVAERFKRAEKALGITIEQTIRYSPNVALKEAVYALSSAAHPVSQDYGNLKSRIEELDRSGLDSLLKLSVRVAEQGEFDRSRELSEALLQEYGDRADARYQIAETCRILGQFDEHEKELAKAIDLEPAFKPAYQRLAALYRAHHRVLEHLQLIKAILANSQKLPRLYKAELLYNLATLFMQLKHYSEAVATFDEYDQTLKRDERSGLIELAIAFNRAEARRRGGEIVDASEWRRIIGLYERGAAVSGAGTLEERMNRSQAMHVAYALAGRRSDAVKLLTEVSDVATQASPRDRVFTLALYDDVPLSHFVTLNEQMLNAIQSKNELWDGTKIPSDTR
jgi:tetratricopeptide (TPR) repeat protein